MNDVQKITINDKPVVAQAQNARAGWTSIAIRMPGGSAIHSVHTVPDWWWNNPDAWSIKTGGNTYKKGQ